MIIVYSRLGGPLVAVTLHAHVSTRFSIHSHVHPKFRPCCVFWSRLRSKLRLFRVTSIPWILFVFVSPTFMSKIVCFYVSVSCVRFACWWSYSAFFHSMLMLDAKPSNPRWLLYH